MSPGPPQELISINTFHLDKLSSRGEAWAPALQFVSSNRRTFVAILKSRYGIEGYRKAGCKEFMLTFIPKGGLWSSENLLSQIRLFARKVLNDRN
jgi:hypothetical protein